MKEFKHVPGREHKVVIAFCSTSPRTLTSISICPRKSTSPSTNTVNSSRATDSPTRSFGRTTTVFARERSVAKALSDIPRHAEHAFKASNVGSKCIAPPLGGIVANPCADIASRKSSSVLCSTLSPSPRISFNFALSFVCTRHARQIRTACRIRRG